MAATPRKFRRRDVVAGLATVTLAGLGTTACTDHQEKWKTVDISGSLPDLKFAMTRVDDGKAVTQADYLGKVTMLYFGYTFCPNVCPVTLANVAEILQKLGPEANDVRLLFVTVDPGRDTPKFLKDYVDAFAPQIDGLRGTDNEIATLARRYRVSYSVHPSPDPDKYVVTHGASLYVFDEEGKVRLLETSLHTDDPDIGGLTADLKRLIHEGRKPKTSTSILSWL